MNDLNHNALPPNEPNRFLSMALDHAIDASHQANLGFRRKQRFLHFDAILKKWEALLVNSQAVQHSVLFLLFFLADILVSWEMNRDIIDQAGFFPGDSPPAWATLLLCLLINGWAAVSANFFAKGWSRDIQALERWNVFHFKTTQNDPITYGQEQDMAYERRKARWYAIVSTTVLFAVVSLIIWHRWWLLQNKGKEAGVSADTISALNAVIILLPLAILLGELITGDYVWYLFQRGIYKLKRGSNWRAFQGHKRACGHADKLAFDDYNTARQQNDMRTDLGEALEKSLYRIRNRALDKDNYIDPVEESHRISFTLVYRENGQPLRRAQVFGVLPSGSKTGDFQTDEHGRAALSWTGNFDRLELITINQQRSEAGPFHENAEHLVRVNIAPPNSNSTSPDNGTAFASPPPPSNGGGAEAVAGG